jgi:uncharacterized protein (DUF1501 family)
MNSRRSFLKKVGVVTAATAAQPILKYGDWAAQAQGSGYRALVCIFMFGGNDGQNMVVPTAASGPRSYPAYANARRELAIPQSQLLGIQGAGGLGYGLHPSLTNLRNRYNGSAKTMAVLFNLGTLIKPTTKAQIEQGQALLPKNLYSHSDQTGEWQTGDARVTGGSGWGGRLIDVLIGTPQTLVPPGVSVNGSSLLLNGNLSKPITISPGSSLGLETFGSGQGSDARVTALTNMLTFNSGATLVTAANGVMSNAIKGAQEIDRAIGSAPPLVTQFPNSGIGSQLEQVTKIIQVRASLGQNRHFFFCGLGGFDNHSDLTSSHNGLMTQLDQGMSAFAQAMEEIGTMNQVTAFTESEFGRTMGPSSTAGSDHAWGSNHFVVGGSVTGGTFGTYADLTLRGPDDAGDRGLWIPSTALDQYAATLGSWFGVSATDLLTVFPNLVNFSTRNLGFMKP